ncbi:ABC transporter substrate-binding protein [Paenibacillus rhizoplanae]
MDSPGAVCRLLYRSGKKGFYKEAGLDVEIRPGGSDFPAVQMVASGSEEFGVTGADQVVIAREKGVPVKALSAIYRKNPVRHVHAQRVRD